MVEAQETDEDGCQWAAAAIIPTDQESNSEETIEDRPTSVMQLGMAPPPPPPPQLGELPTPMMNEEMSPIKNFF